MIPTMGGKTYNAIYGEAVRAFSKKKDSIKDMSRKKKTGQKSKGSWKVRKRPKREMNAAEKKVHFRSISHK